MSDRSKYTYGWTEGVELAGELGREDGAPTFPTGGVVGEGVVSRESVPDEASGLNKGVVSEAVRDLRVGAKKHQRDAARNAPASFIRAGMSNSVVLRAGADSYAVKLDAGDLQVSGLAGVRPPMVTLTQFVSLEAPGVLVFLQGHDVVDVEYLDQQAAWGGSDRRLVAHGCRLEDATLVELQSGVAIRYTFRAHHLSGDLVPGLSS